jgi:hypothetical protein
LIPGNKILFVVETEHAALGVKSMTFKREGRVIIPLGVPQETQGRFERLTSFLDNRDDYDNLVSKNSSKYEL